LVNTVGYVQGTLQLGKVEYGWAMAAFGIGATLASVVFGNFNQRFQRTTFIVIGALLITVALLPANYVSLAPLLLLWLIAGAGQSLVNLPTQTLIADRTPTELQGRVYGAHFAWSHLWWAFAYPLAGWLGSQQTSQTFLYGSLIGFVLLVAVQLILKPQEGAQEIVWHDHEHFHDQYHQHQHDAGILLSEPHMHPHRHIGSSSSEQQASS
jgi:MFS transporter, NRE family, putaive nickel resistance protein